jgi:leucyl/phenylalanyl-tRNA--protein transferase
VPVYRLNREIAFPHPSLARKDGLLAVGGDLSVPRLLLAYSNGIFPWYSDDDPILWWSPPVRPVLKPSEVHVGRSLEKAMRKRPYVITLDRAFPRVIEECALASRPGEPGTWITPDMRRAYTALHEAGFAHSAEAWLGEALVGGLYGVSLGGVFFGESMFAKGPDASKIAFVTLCRQISRWGIELIDSQVTNEHTQRFGTVEIPREEFLVRVAELLKKPTLRGKWALEEDLASEK